MIGGPMILAPVNGNPEKCAVIQNSDNTVINLIMADPSVDPAPDGCAIIQLVNDDYINPVSIGWQYDASTGQFTDPNPPVEAQV